VPNHGALPQLHSLLAAAQPAIFISSKRMPCKSLSSFDYWLCYTAWLISLPLGAPMSQAESTVTVTKAVIGLKTS